ncbi:MAG: hypothetical protein M3Y22_16995 [Pseudomonadota bacterium]|nr:hypothetical protein [Pseudomonadota bacterium]
MAVLGAVLAIVFIAHRAIDRPRHGARFAQAIMAGQRQARSDAGEEPLDRDLAADEAAGGAMWARSHGATNPDECPLDPPAMRRGCAAYVTAHER